MSTSVRTMRVRQAGYSIVELMVAMVIALFLLAGMITVLSGTRTTSSNQNLLAQLQDNERVAMTMITNVVQVSGYYPNAQTLALQDELASTTLFPNIGQVVGGVADPVNTRGYQLYARYNAGANEDILDCTGASNSTHGAEVKNENVFSVQQDSADTPFYLACSLNGAAPVKLVEGVTRIDISYGVNTSATLPNTTDGAVDAYLKAENMTPLYWTNVYSVKVVLTFTNPLYLPRGHGNPTPGQAPTVQFTRVIGVMSRIGVNVVNFT